MSTGRDTSGDAVMVTVMLVSDRSAVEREEGRAPRLKVIVVGFQEGRQSAQR